MIIAAKVSVATTTNRRSRFRMGPARRAGFDLGEFMGRVSLASLVKPLPDVLDQPTIAASQSCVIRVNPPSPTGQALQCLARAFRMRALAVARDQANESMTSASTRLNWSGSSSITKWPTVVMSTGVIPCLRSDASSMGS